MADQRLTVDGMCFRYGPPLERLWAERHLAVPDEGVTYVDDHELVILGNTLKDLLEALVRQQVSTDRASALAADPQPERSKLNAARAQAKRIDGLITGALADKDVRGQLYRLKALIGSREDRSVR